jgi:hypothetical protein
LWLNALLLLPSARTEKRSLFSSVEPRSLAKTIRPWELCRAASPVAAGAAQRMSVMAASLLTGERMLFAERDLFESGL